MTFALVAMVQQELQEDRSFALRVTVLKILLCSAKRRNVMKYYCVVFLLALQETKSNVPQPSMQRTCPPAALTAPLLARERHAQNPCDTSYGTVGCAAVTTPFFKTTTGRLVVVLSSMPVSHTLLIATERHGRLTLAVLDIRFPVVHWRRVAETEPGMFVQYGSFRRTLHRT